MTEQRSKPRGRFAPSPSGRMHLGNAWTALLAWLDIRKMNGTMVLRMEDLDPDRSRPEYAAGLIEDLRWLGLDWDEGPDTGGLFRPYCQSERTALYQKVFNKLDRAGLVYPCFCSRAELRSAASAPHAGETEVPYNGRCAAMNPTVAAQLRQQGRRPSYRLRVDDARVEYVDAVYGAQSQELRQVCGDFVIRRSDGVFAYQLAVVADDASMQINRVLRGADLLASTPRQIYLWRLLGEQPPTFLHVPLLVGGDGGRLSKRHGSLAIAALREGGVSAKKIVGRLAAWAGLIDHPAAVKPQELIRQFDAARLPREPIRADDPLGFV